MLLNLRKSVILFSSDPKKFVMLLQFFTYAQQLELKIDFLGDTSYQTVHFRIDHFLKFQNPTLKSTSYYKAEKLYNGCLKNNRDVSEIAEKNTLKKENVQKCKDHIFNNEYLLDQYEELGEPAEYKKFDPYLKQALA